MSTILQNLTVAKPARRLICAALASAITTLTTQTLVQSAGQHEYGIGAIPLSTIHPSTFHLPAIHWSATNWSATRLAAPHLAAAGSGVAPARRIRLT